MNMKLHYTSSSSGTGNANGAASTYASTSSNTNPNNKAEKKTTKSLLLINITPIECAYTKPDETPEMTSFCTRHTEGCHISAYDPEAIQYLGHLPQDVIGHSVFECYHPVDMPFMRHVYEEIVSNKGKLYKSKPYRFRTFNGSYVLLETEWMCFVNPWNKKIESIIGQHNIFKGPSDIAIFLDPGDKASSPLPDEVLKEAKKARTDIVALLQQVKNPIASYMDPSKAPQEVRRKTLAHVMSSIVEELDSLEKKDVKTTERRAPPPFEEVNAPVNNKAQPSGVHPSVVEKGQESVNSSCEAPSSYGQLNYSETIHRFFRSHPKTVSSDESGDSKMEVSHVDSIDCKSSSHRKFSVSGGSGNHKQSHTNSQSQSCSGSGDNYCGHTRQSDSTANGSGSGDTGRTSSAGRSYHHVQLTEEILCKHNANMQKMFLQRQRTGSRVPRDKWKRPLKKSIKRPSDRTQGVKRSCAVLDHDVRVSKHPFIAPSAGESGSSLKPPSANIWPQAESRVSMPPCGTNVGSLDASVGRASRLTNPTFPNIMPGFYIPTSTSSMPSLPPINNIAVPQPPGPTLVMQHQQPSFLQPQTSMALPLQYVGAFPGVMYQPVGPPLFNAPQLMLPNVVYQHTVVQPPLGQVTIPQQSDGEKRSGAESEQELESGKRFGVKRPLVNLHRPDSQATSVKAEPGSARGSNASASGKLISSYSHAAESIRSYIEDMTQLSPGCIPKESQLSQSTSVQAEAESIGSPGKQEKMTVGDQGTHMDMSSDMVMSVTSSNYSSREYKSTTDDSLQNVSENSENSEASQSEPRWSKPRSKCRRPVLNDPPWLENVEVTPELLYKYQLETKELVEVLRHDMEMLKRTKQPSWVDDQLSSLYNELELDGSSPDLHLEEGVTSSSGEEQAGTSYAQDENQRKKKNSSYFSRMAMLHEENAPMPSPDAWDSRHQQPAEYSSSSS